MSEFSKRWARYLVLILLIVALIFLIFLSGTRNVTGNVSADFIFQRRLLEGERLSGSLRIVADEVLPLDSVVVLRLGDVVVEKPLYFILDDSQRESVESNLVIYPEVKVDLDVSVSSPSGGSDLTNSISGFTISGYAPVTSVAGSSGGGSSDDSTYSTQTSIKSASVGVISFEKDTSVTKVSVKSARLSDGTNIPISLVSYKIVDNKIDIISNYKESVKGFSKNKVLKVPLSVFDVKTKIGEIAISIKYKGGDLIKGGEKIYTPISVRSSDDSNLREVIFGKTSEQIPMITDCGETKCSVKECVLPNFDSDVVLDGNLQKGLVNVVTCSNLCVSNKEVYSCEQKKEIKTNFGSIQGDNVILDVFDKDLNTPVAKVNAQIVKGKIKTLDISFNN